MRSLIQGLVAMTLLGMQANAAASDVDIDQLAADKLDWIESDADLALVKQYAKAGAPLIAPAASTCQADLPDVIGSGHYRFCVALTELPADVQDSLAAMQASRFDNMSDYDQRVTRYVVARHDGSILTAVAEHGAEALAALIDIDPVFLQGTQTSRPPVGSFAWLGALRGIWVGETVSDESPLYKHAAGLSSGDYQQISFGPDEVSLYPGGGYTTGFTFYVNAEYLIYVKNEGWNS